MISLKKADYEKILAHAKSCVPEEACGLIAGNKDGEDKVVEKGIFVDQYRPFQ